MAKRTQTSRNKEGTRIYRYLSAHMSRRLVFQIAIITSVVVLTHCGQPKPEPKPKPKIDRKAAKEMFEELKRRVKERPPAEVDSVLKEGDETFDSNESIRPKHTTPKGSSKYPNDLGNGWVRTQGQVEWSSLIPLQKLKTMALQRARSEAIFFVNGVRIQDIIAIYESTESGLRIAEMTKEIRGGYITAKREPIWETLEEENSTFPYALRVTIDVRIEKDTGTVDPAFHIEEVKLNRNNYEVGDHMTMTVSATRDCYITVFNQSMCVPESPVTILFPNDYSGSNFVGQNEVLTIPDSEHWHLTMAIPQGFEECDETITVVATKSDIPFWAQVKKTESRVGGFLRIDYETRVELLAKWIVSIPLEQRTEATALYNTFATE